MVTIQAVIKFAWEVMAAGAGLGGKAYEGANVSSVEHARGERSVGRLIGRVIVGVLSAMLIVGGGVFLRSGLALRARCVDAERAEMLNVPIDVSAAGVQHVRLTQTAAFTCRQIMWIEMDDAGAGSEKDAATALRGLAMIVKVRDRSGSAVMEGAYPTMFPDAAEEGRVVIVNAWPMPVGEYDVEVDVVTPAASTTSGRPGVRLMSKYQLCGIEWMAPTIGIWAGGAGASVGLLVAAGLWASSRRARA